MIEAGSLSMQYRVGHISTEVHQHRRTTNFFSLVRLSRLYFKIPSSFIYVDYTQPEVRERVVLAGLS